MQVTRLSRIPASFWKTDEGFENLIRQFTRRFAPTLDVPASGTEWIPSVEVIENDDELIVTAELPGLELKDVHVELTEDMLVIRGAKEDTKQNKEQRYRVWERTYGSFERVFTLPRTIDQERIYAEMDKGVLSIVMPKVPTPAPKRIEVGQPTHI